MIHNDVWRHLHNQHRFNYQQDSCCTVGETHGWHDGPHRCDVVQEGERVQSEADESGNRFTLVADAASWESARSECINQNGKIANIQTEAQFEQVLTLMRETGVANAWICNEVAAPGDGASTGLVGEFQAWGSDVTIPAGGSGEPDRLQTTLLAGLRVHTDGAVLQGTTSGRGCWWSRPAPVRQPAPARRLRTPRRSVPK